MATYTSIVNVVQKMHWICISDKIQNQKNKTWTKIRNLLKSTVSQCRCALTSGSLVAAVGCTQSMLGTRIIVTLPLSLSSKPPKAACPIPKREELCQGCMTCHLKWRRINPRMLEPQSRIYALVALLHDRNRHKEIVQKSMLYLTNRRQWIFSHCCTSKHQVHPHHQKVQTNHRKPE